MSYLNAGIGKLTERIYVALADVKAIRVRVFDIQLVYPPLHRKTVEAKRALAEKTAYTTGLVEAWEIVTGEIWGEASWQPTGSRN